MPKAIAIQQMLVGDSSVANGDYTLPISGVVVDVQVECRADSGYSALVGWDEDAQKDLILPGASKSYGVPESGKPMRVGMALHVNFDNTGSGNKAALVTIWKEVEDENAPC